MLGPTGCGKTFMVELLFQHILKLPTVIVDITSFTESGYIGDDVRTILARLMLNANGNQHLAEIGVVCLDEFDKIASSSSSARFAGQGTIKDVSGYGVQRELLGMMHGANVVVPMDYGFSEYGPRVQLSTQKFGFLPELIGRFTRIVSFPKLSTETLKQILTENVLPQLTN